MIRHFALLVLACSIVASSPAAEPTERYWYEVTLVTGNSTQSFTGSSALPPSEFSAALRDKPVALEDLRIQGVKAGEEVMRWHPIPERSAVHIMPGTTVYFYSLNGDPAKDSS